MRSQKKKKRKKKSNISSSQREKRELQLSPLSNKIMQNSRSSWRQRHHPWHAAVWDWKQMLGLDGYGESYYKVSRNSWGHNWNSWYDGSVWWLTIHYTKRKKAKYLSKAFFHCSNPFVDRACSLLLAVMSNTYCAFPGLTWNVSVMVKPMYTLQICPSFWASVSFLHAQKAVFYARGWLSCTYNWQEDSKLLCLALTQLKWNITHSYWTLKEWYMWFNWVWVYLLPFPFPSSFDFPIQ